MKHTSLAISLASAAFALVVFSGTSPLTARALRAQGDKPATAPSYTEEQSTRGESVYTKSCVFCHADQAMAPALQGDVFLKNWSDKTAAALFDKIQTTMPANEPGTLTPQDAADLIAYILKVNHFPAGQEALPKDPALLGTITLSAK